MRIDCEEMGGDFSGYEAFVIDGMLSWEIPVDGWEFPGVRVFIEETIILPAGSEPVRDWRKALGPLTSIPVE
jgi:hypothetical protein